MEQKKLENYVELYLNNKLTEADILPDLPAGLAQIDKFRYNTVKRLIKTYQKYKDDMVSADVLLCSLRNYLVVFQIEVKIEENDFLLNNNYGIYESSDGKYCASLELPDGINENFVKQAFQRNAVEIENMNDDDIFYGTNAYIYNLTGFREFKSLNQKIAVYGALNTPDGYTTLVSLPTGGGKSLITQTMAYQQQGLTIVVVPTVSLAIDQVRTAKLNIKHDTEVEIFCYYSGIEFDRKKALEEAILQEKARLLFISPEALIRNSQFKDMIVKANTKKYLKNLIIDEAHIVIEWGDFFRVDYQCLEPWRNGLIAGNAQLKTVLLSATFTKNTVNNLKQMFSQENKWIEIRCDALRHEPRFILYKAKSYSDKRKVMVELVKKLPHPMIVYVNSPKEAESIRQVLTEEGINNLETFTGNTKSAERERIIKDWTNDEIDLIIATSAFGVGVDKGDVRTVLHLYIPDTPDQYYQELGRGGRDCLASLSVMCIEPQLDMDSAYKRMGKVLGSDKIWGRWKSMFESQTSLWHKGMVTLDTSIKPTYNSTDDNSEASDIDIQWNVYVILLLRRYNLLNIKDMIYDAQKEYYRIRVEILEESLRNETQEIPNIITIIRDKEAKRFETGMKRITESIKYSERLCWSEMFYSTYNKVSEYCAGCNQHEKVESMEKNKFPLLLPVKEPYKEITAELNSLYQKSEELLLIGEEGDFTLANIFMKRGASIIVVDRTEIDKNFDLILNMNRRSNIMIISLKEYRELRMQNSDYYISGGVIALYEPDNNNKYERYITLKNYQNEKVKIVHLMPEDYYLSQVQKPISSVIDGPKIDSYILERM